MTNIQEIRKKYPQYSDLSDEQLANSLHKKYYSDMPIDQFYNSINLNKANDGMALFEEMRANDKALSQIGLQSTLALGDYLSNSLSTAGRSLINPFRRAVGMENIQPNPIKTSSGPIYEKAYEYAPVATALSGGLVAGAPRAATMTGTGSLIGGLLDEEDPIGGMLYGGGTAGLGEGAGRLISSAVSKYGPPVLKAGQDWLRGNLPTEEILRRVEAAKGTATGLGRILDQPQLTQILENVSRYSPFSGYQKGVNKTIANMEARAASNLDELSGGEIPQDVEVLEEIQKQLQNSVGNKIKLSDANYRKLDELANQLGVKVNRDDITQTAREMLKKIRSNPELARKTRPGIIQDLEFYANPSKGRPQNIDEALTGSQPKQEYGFNESNLTRSLLGEDQYEALLASKRHESGQYGTLKKALDRDMRVAIEKSGDPELEGLWQEAQKFYKNEIVPTQSPRIKKFVNDPDLSESENIIATFLKYGPKQDRVKLLKQLTNHLDEKGMERLRYAVFSDELGESSIQNMTKVWHRLGPKQKAELIPDEVMRENMEAMAQVAKMNPKAIHQMYNPETGAWAKVMEMVKGIAGIAAGSATTGGSIVGARMATELLTNEKARNAIIKRLLDEGYSNKAAKDVIDKFAKPYAKGKNVATGVAAMPSKEKE
jgi:hypothetical protein